MTQGHKKEKGKELLWETAKRARESMNDERKEFN